MTLFSILISISAFLFFTTSSFSISKYLSGYKYGYIDDSVKVFIDIQFDQAYNFKDSIAPVYKDGKWGWINTDGKYIITPEFEEVFVINYKHIFATAKKNEKWGIVDDKGTFLIDPQYEYLYPLEKIQNKFMV